MKGKYKNLDGKVIGTHVHKFFIGQRKGIKVL